MGAYQSIFTQVQLRTPPEAGVPLPLGNDKRSGRGGYQ
jgi:hypothetical protein